MTGRAGRWPATPVCCRIRAWQPASDRRHRQRRRAALRPPFSCVRTGYRREHQHIAVRIAQQQAATSIQRKRQLCACIHQRAGDTFLFGHLGPDARGCGDDAALQDQPVTLQVIGAA
ncbi:hypothetical protein DF40_016760 [Stenotrophomonas maltophilia M30]|nr:hypothetical protein DF40_016760 [Stenotrophomonas maltophilia M30]